MMMVGRQRTQGGRRKKLQYIGKKRTKRTRNKEQKGKEKVAKRDTVLERCLLWFGPIDRWEIPKGARGEKGEKTHSFKGGSE